MPRPMSTILLWILVTVAGLAAAAGRVEGAAPDATDLLADRQAWSSWAARPELATRSATEPAGGPSGQPVLVLSATGNPDACGCWKRPLPTLRKDRRYRIEAAFRADGVPLPGQSVWALLTQGDREYAELVYKGTRDGWGRMSLELTPDRDLPDLDLRLYLAWSAEGRVGWSDAVLTDITNRPPQRRTARLVAISGRPKDPATSDDCLDYYCARIDEVGRQAIIREIDLICLPEVINTDGIAGDRSKLAETIPGPFTDRLAEKARQYNTYIAASLLERDGDRRYNTGVLLDRSGTVVGKYRKTHPTVGEMFLKGITPGADYPVFETDFGRVGYMICYDNHFPEVARILSLKGAQVVLHSNMADNREHGALWEPVMRIRAVDNNVHLVTSGNDGRSGVFSPRGDILSRTEKGGNPIALADCELGITVRNYTRRDIGERYLQVRRASTFLPLTHDYWEYRKDDGPRPTSEAAGKK